MHFVLIAAVLVAILIGPQLWIRWVLRRYREDLSGMPGTGAELANHLIKRFELGDILVEECQPNQDHFDGQEPAIRLSPDNYHGRSLTAIAIAAHEVGHAIQWHRKEPVFQLRSRFIPIARQVQRLGFMVMSLAPIVGLVLRSPAGFALPIIGGVLATLCGAAVYLVVLPEEFDASFNKALPILIDGDYISEAQQPAVRRILKAAALTYVAGAFASILQLWRWLPLLLRR